MTKSGLGSGPVSCPLPHQGGCARRQFLKIGLAATGVAALAPTAAAATTRPVAGDALVFQDGPRANTEIRSQDIAVGAPPILAWPMAPGSALVRSDDRTNQVLLLRFAPDRLAPQAAPWAAGGIVAFSAICTHAACAVTDWDAGQERLRCPCHGSEFDPRAGGAVLFGPASRTLPALPLQQEADALRVAGGFTDWIGGDSTKAD
ncbi:MAG: Rieske (2Fe-2S) protein [Azospirillaceae bacterium]|nr:Rieske (2Fe-2S) protein [Azospirillaceae bacterium]